MIFENIIFRCTIPLRYIYSLLLVYWKVNLSITVTHNTNASFKIINSFIAWNIVLISFPPPPPHPHPVH